MSVAFTHGYTEEAFANGLTHSPDITKVKKGARFISEHFGQELEYLMLPINDPSIIQEALSNVLAASDSCWVAYYTGKNADKIIGHMIGIIPTAPGEYTRWDSYSDQKIAKVNIDQLMQGLIDSKLNLYVHVFGFSTPDKKHVSLDSK